MSDLRDKLGDHAFRYYDLWHTIKNNWQDSIVLTIALILFLATIILYMNVEPKSRVYDCSLAEISPDFPIEVKNECRKIRTTQT
jgi:hypothetical protein